MGFNRNTTKDKNEKVLYHLKVATTSSLNAFSGKYRLVQSYDPAKNTIKYLLSSKLNWEAKKIIYAYANRWVIEEFFRNAKQLTNMEGTCLRSEQGVTLALCLVSWADFLLHYENYKNSAVKNFKKKPLTVQSIIRRQQLINTEEFVERVRKDDCFVTKWINFLKKETDRYRKTHSELEEIARSDSLTNGQPKTMPVLLST